MPAAAFDADTEYRAIERTLLESARGRWFLAEHGRRARRLDSALLEDALGRLQSSLREPPALLGRLRTEIEGLTAAVAQLKTDVTAKEASLATAVPAAVKGAGSLTGGIIASAETIHELAWSLQANEIDAEACEKISAAATNIYALSHAQAVTSTRARHVATALDDIDRRLAAVLETVLHELQRDTGGAAPAPA